MTGTVPRNFLTELPAPPPTVSRMTAIYSYTPDDPTELPFNKGDVLDVLTPVAEADSSAAVAAVVESGWLLVRRNDIPGFVPSNYLQAFPKE